MNTLLLVSFQLYCAQWLGKDHIIVGGCDANMVRVIDRGTLKVNVIIQENEKYKT